jgi:hypothetical protein
MILAFEKKSHLYIRSSITILLALLLGSELMIHQHASAGDWTEHPIQHSFILQISTTVETWTLRFMP